MTPEFSPETAVAELAAKALQVGLDGGESDNAELVAAARSIGEQHGAEALARTAAALAGELVEAVGEVVMSVLAEEKNRQGNPL